MNYYVDIYHRKGSGKHIFVKNYPTTRNEEKANQAYMQLSFRGANEVHRLYDDKKLLRTSRMGDKKSKS